MLSKHIEKYKQKFSDIDNKLVESQKKKKKVQLIILLMRMKLMDTTYGTITL